MLIALTQKFALNKNNFSSLIQVLLIVILKIV